MTDTLAPVVPLRSYPVLRPSDVLPEPDTLNTLVAWDTECSGLFPDDGATVAVVSVAWVDPVTAEIRGAAFPFDQGRAEDKGFKIARNAKGEIKALVGTNPIALTVEEWEQDVNLSRADWDWLMDWLRCAGRRFGLAAHNAKYDLHMTRTGTRHWPGLDLERVLAWDSLLAQAILDPTESFALKTTAARMWGAHEAEEAAELQEALAACKRLYGLVADDGPRYDLVPWSKVGPYAAQDAVLTLRLALLQTQRFEDGDGDGSFWRMQQALDLCRVLYRLERRGFGDLDVERTERFATALEGRIAELEATLPFSPPTSYQACAYFFDELGLRPWKGGEEPREIEVIVGGKKDGSDKVVVRKRGSLNLPIMQRMAAAEVPHAATMAELTRLKTSNQMHYRGYLNLVGPDRKIRTNYKQAFVKSGRMSVERFQAQAIPRRDSTIFDLYGRRAPHPRDLFNVPEGRVRYNIDLSQAELRVAAIKSGAKLMIEQIEQGRDIHGEMCTQVFGYEPDHPKFTEHRYIAKRCVFGGIFMVGPQTFHDEIFKHSGVDLSMEICRQTVHGFRDLYPEIEQIYNEYQDRVIRDGYVELVDGRRSYFAPHDQPRTAWNRYVQGSLGITNAEWLIYSESVTEDYEAIVLTVHDAIVADFPIEEAERLAGLIADWVPKHFRDTYGIAGKADVEAKW